MKHLTVDTVKTLHRQTIEASGGSPGIRETGILEGAVNRPFATFDGQDLFPSLWDKAAALAHGIAHGHPFIDGNKRTAQMAMEVLLILNGWEVAASVDEQEAVFLELAAGMRTVNELAQWLKQHTIRLKR